MREVRVDGRCHYLNVQFLELLDPIGEGQNLRRTDERADEEAKEKQRRRV